MLESRERERLEAFLQTFAVDEGTKVASWDAPACER